MTRVLVFALTMPPSPVLYRDFETRTEANRWSAWAKSAMPCHVRKQKQPNTSPAPVSPSPQVEDVEAAPDAVPPTVPGAASPTHRMSAEAREANQKLQMKLIRKARGE